jgi:hypothetical protein
MFINNPAVTGIEVSKKRDRSGAVRQTLVVKTKLEGPVAAFKDGEMSDFKKLVSEVRDLRELSQDEFVGIETIEIQGPQWKAWVNEHGLGA